MFKITGTNIYSYPSNSILSEELRRRLIALGIDPSTVTSEAQAIKIIQSLTGIQKIPQSSKPNTEITCSSESELISKAKILASKLGISTKQGETLNEILVKISRKINEISQTNPQDAKNYSRELDSIKSGYTTINKSETEMFTAMNYQANLNKMMLGLQNFNS